ncbi:MAG: dihydropteroate synthase, partial [Actinomycetota bacterium]|nr:dihydropteroate synthase [Actinomycetota bacterium]
EEERRRVMPVVRALADVGGLVSVDTMRADVAAAALDAGAVMVNDVSGGLNDRGMLPLVARAQVPYVAMHWRGHSETMQQRATYDDVVADVVRELRDRLDAAVAAGVDPRQVVLDPGIGFAKNGEHIWTLLGNLDALAALGRPVLVGASRKAFLGQLLTAPDGSPRDVRGRDDATTAVTALAAHAGAWAVRVHAVRPARDAVLVAAAVRAARPGAGCI